MAGRVFLELTPTTDGVGWCLHGKKLKPESYFSDRLRACVSNIFCIASMERLGNEKHTWIILV